MSSINALVTEAWAWAREHDEMATEMGALRLVAAILTASPAYEGSDLDD